MLRQRWTRNDRGVTLVELMVVMIIMGLLAGVVISAIMWGTRTTTAQTRNAELWADMQDASTQLARDVNDASSVTLSDANSLTVQVVRDEKCQVRAWVADATTKRLTVTTTFYDQAACSGGSSVREDRVIGNNAIGTNASGSHPTRYLSPVTFAYFDNLSTVPLATPSEGSRVSRISWTLVAEADVGYRDQTLTAGAAFTPRPESDTGTGDHPDALTPLLCASLAAPVASACGPVPAAAAGKLEGVDNPVLQWVDPTPTLTQGWTLWRIANPEGMSGTDPARTTWAWLGVTGAATTTFTDTTLPAGYTAQYVVRATIATGVGPESNQVVTGKRPAMTVTRATGATTQIAVNWDVAVGATGYDIYRDGTLAQSVTSGSTLTWTDTVGQSGWSGAGYGHSHFYRAVPVNRWENRLTTGTDPGRLALGNTLGNYPVGGARLASVQNAASGAFTAPAAPTNAVTPNANRSSDNTWTPAPWVGAGPVTGRNATWVVQYRSSSESASTVATLAGGTVAFNHPSRPAGRWSEYQVFGRNTSGDGPASGFKRAWQRPATPSCVANAPTTRSMVVTGSLASTVDEAYGDSQLNVRILGGAWFSNPTTVDPLPHGTSSTFGARANGSGGWSDEGSCAGTTLTLGVTITGVSSNTRSVSATMSTAYGNSSSLTLEGVRTDANVTGATWDPLPDGTGYTVTARNSDGFNDVVAQQNVSTVTLATPGVPTCVATLVDSIALGTISVGGGTEVKLGSGGSVYSGPRSFSGLGAGTYYGYARNVASDGYNTAYSGWDSCPGRTIIGPPATPSSGFNFTQQRYCAPAVGFSLRASWSAVAGATSYDIRMHYNTTGGYAGWDTHTLAGTITNWETYDTTMIFGTGQVQVRANNAAGSSAWSTTVTAAVSGGCQAG